MLFLVLPNDNVLPAICFCRICRNVKWTPVALRTNSSIVRITEISQGVEISVSSRVARIMRKQHKLFTVVC